jgi:hypothetical protein
MFSSTRLRFVVVKFKKFWCFSHFWVVHIFTTFNLCSRIVLPLEFSFFHLNSSYKLSFARDRNTFAAHFFVQMSKCLVATTFYKTTMWKIFLFLFFFLANFYNIISHFICLPRFLPEIILKMGQATSQFTDDELQDYEVRWIFFKMQQKIILFLNLIFRI